MLQDLNYILALALTQFRNDSRLILNIVSRYTPKESDNLSSKNLRRLIMIKGRRAYDSCFRDFHLHGLARP
jgi:hypothetical protein